MTSLGHFDLIRSLLPCIFKLLKVHKFFSVSELNTIRSSASAMCGWTTCFQKRWKPTKAQSYTIFCLTFLNYITSEHTKNIDNGLKTWGVGAIGLACMRYIHPSKEIQEKYGGTAVEKNKLHGLRIVGRSMMRLCSRGK